MPRFLTLISMELFKKYSHGTYGQVLREIYQMVHLDHKGLAVQPPDDPKTEEQISKLRERTREQCACYVCGSNIDMGNTEEYYRIFEVGQKNCSVFCMHAGCVEKIPKRLEEIAEHEVKLFFRRFPELAEVFTKGYLN